MEEDILSDIPEALQLRILSCLDAKQAVQTSMLSRTWVSLWTKIPVLEYNRKHIYKRQEKRVLEDLLFFFSRLHNVKSLMLYSPIALLLNFYPDELMKRSSPFRVLTNVKLEFQVHCGRALDLCDDSCKESAFKCVKEYLLQHVPDATFTVTLLKVDEWCDDDVSDIFGFN
ncbi:unnamed protein product [Lactuca virosa]|uniref:F-box domain-containing protein n=1 Tax=Lactuca virosa TaxID=75947 RepID=A0AAU9NGR0_9ASTR|nr:unnamed protein product [Lactuca virosa]